MSTKRQPGKGLRRRDFLDGMAIGAAGLLGARGRGDRGRLLADPAGAQPPGASYPPALTGMRGSHDGAFEVAHAIRDGSFWDLAGNIEETREEYDLVVVGAGLSGLAAAKFYRDRAGPKARILILDNHDDFGGHARRNEFRSGDRMLLSYGGSYAVDSPGPWGPVPLGLLRELGIDPGRGPALLDRELYGSLGLGRGVFLDRETFGTDSLLPDPLGDFGGEADDRPPRGRDPWPVFQTKAPLPPAAMRDLVRLCKGSERFMAGLSPADKKAKLARMSYARFLDEVARVDALVGKFLQARTHSLYGVGIDAVPAQDAWGVGLPGFQGMELGSEPGPGMGRDALPPPAGGKTFFHFPDGNASLARLLIRHLIPATLAPGSADESVTARFAYGRLDSTASPIRVRLSSTVVRARHAGPLDAARQVEVVYSRRRRLSRVRAAHCILACWHGIIPHLAEELPEAQREALAYGVKVPLVYTSVLLRDWQAFQRLGFSAIHAPAAFHSTVNLCRPVSIGAYRSPRTPSEPMVLHLVRTPCMPGLPSRQQHRMGRVELLSMPFSVFEERTRDQLGRMLGSAGFDPARDIEAITVNRWSHGYPYQYNSLWDPFWLTGAEPPCDRARRPFGRIAIANADAAAYSYADAAIEQAHRAVTELLGKRG